jgi:hypothetical protein
MLVLASEMLVRSLKVDRERALRSVRQHWQARQ